MMENRSDLGKSGYQRKDMHIHGFNVTETPVSSTKFDLKREDLERLIDGLSKEDPSKTREALCHLATDMANQLDHSRDTLIYVDPLMEGGIAGRYTVLSEVTVDKENHLLTVSHLGVTLRRLMGAAAGSDSSHRRWRIALAPSNVIIGDLRLASRKTE